MDGGDASRKVLLIRVDDFSFNHHLFVALLFNDDTSDKPVTNQVSNKRYEQDEADNISNKTGQEQHDS